MSSSRLNAVGLFAGIGGIERGLMKAGFEVSLANEIDPYAAISYLENYKHDLIVGDISDLQAERLPSPLSLLSGGFPCQPFSVAGQRKGFEDSRGNVYWEIERLFNSVKPDVVFLENVKNLVTHDSGNTFRVIQESLEKANYFVRYQVLNASTHGNIPQNRERIYIVAFRSKKSWESFSFPEPIPLTSRLSDFIDFDSKVDDKYYYGPKNPFFDELEKDVNDSQTVYQWRRKYVRANKTGVCPTLTANMGMGGHNVPIIKAKHGIRKLTPMECLRLMGFDDFVLPEGLVDSRIYKQAGNAVVVPVIQRIAKEIKSALEV